MRKIISSILFIAGSMLAVLSHAQSGYISTFAGTGGNDYSGDGDPAVLARLSVPFGVKADGAGNIYISDNNFGVVRKVDAGGIITTVAGYGSVGYSGDGHPATLAQLYKPTGITIDAAGNLYIVDAGNNVIRKVSTSGIITTVAGYWPGYSLYGIGGYSGDGGPATAAELNEPYDIAVDGSGNIYIADTHNSVVRKVDDSGIITTFAGMPDSVGYSGDGGAATAAKLSGVNGIALDGFGNLYIADYLNYIIRKINTSGIISTIAGIPDSAGYNGDGGAAIAALLNDVTGLSLDSHGNIYFCQGNLVREIDTSGIINTIAGNPETRDLLGTFSGDYGLATNARLNKPAGVAVDPSGNIYITDAYNSRVRIVTSTRPVAGVTQVSSGAIDNIVLMPNPNKGTFTIKGSLNSVTDENVSFDVMNILGQSVYKNNVTVQKGEINAQIALDDNLPDGMYLLQVRSGAESSISRLVINR